MDKLKLIKDIGFDFSWDVRKVWNMHEPVVLFDIEKLIWHFDIPFWNEKGGIYNLSPQEVIAHPELHEQEWKRVQDADTSHPLDVMENKGRWLLLDGLHRLTKLYLAGEKKVKARFIPRGRIPEMINLDETITECLRTLREEFPHVYQWKDKPDAKYEEHAHKGNVAFYIVEGWVIFKYSDGSAERQLSAGDRMDVTPGRKHTAKVGPEGCTWVVGEMIKGDS